MTITYGPKAQTKIEETKTGWVRFSFDKEKDNIVDSQVSAIDGRSGQSTAQVPSDADKLKAAGWKLP